MDKVANLSTWAAQYRRFAESECQDDPLYVAICLALAESPEMLALMAEAPETQRRPNLLLAALHERLLAGVAHPLAAYYPSCGGQRAPDGELPGLLLDLVRQERAGLIQHLRSRATQTNEIGRCAVLWPALSYVSQQTGRSELALFDFGSSAGLNLAVDRYRYDYGPMGQRGAPEAPDTPRLACRWQGEAALPGAAPWRLVARLGCDLAPVDVRDADATRWLRACLWPCDLERARRLDLALGLARRHGDLRVQPSSQGLLLLEQWLDALPPGVQPVLLNTWVLAYFEAQALQAYRARVADLVRRRGLAWLSAEAPSLAPPEARPPEALPAGYQAGSTSLWTLQMAEAGGVRTQALAWSHPHGRWLHWLS
ncbi:MAG: DUF2332 domain-containing protein [Roseateles asaccharophilus]|uniref:DUF2332 domain-containing protein n=1 Tax=Roseateles asaccharophilus TaxID=582607 RepID=UPI003918FDDB